MAGADLGLKAISIAFQILFPTWLVWFREQSVEPIS